MICTVAIREYIFSAYILDFLPVWHCYEMIKTTSFFIVNIWKKKQFAEGSFKNYVIKNFEH